MITIAHLIPRIPKGGGAENLLLDICRSMDPARFKVIVFYWADGDDLALPLRTAGAVVVRLRLNPRAPYLSIGPLVRAMKAHHGDVLHTHFMDSDLLGFLSGWFTHAPMVMHVHSFPVPRTRLHAWRYRLMSVRISKIVCVSRFVQQFVAASTGIDSGKMAVVANGTDLLRFNDHFTSQQKADLKQSLGLDARAFIVGTVTRLEPDKAVETLLKAAPLILARHPQARILVVGDGVERSRLEKLARTLGLEGVVLFSGLQQNVPWFLSIIDVFVMTAAEEAFGLSLLEAMAAGKPVAVACALPELVRDGQEGLLFPPRDGKGLAEAVLRLREEPALAAHLAEQGMVRAREFTCLATAKHLEQVYAEVLKRD